MRKKHVNEGIKKDDYCLYSFSIPLSVAAFRNRKKLVDEQLEKNHPVLSPAFITFYKYRIKKRTLSAEAAVIERKTLFSYRSSSSKKSLYLEGTSFKVPLFNKRKRQSGTALVFGLLFTAVLFVFLNLSSGTFFLRGGNTNSGKKVKEEKVEVSAFPYVTEICDFVLSRVYAQNGRVSRLEWDSKKINFTVNKCFPEQIVFDRPCAVSYKNGSPSFSIAFDLTQGAKDCTEGSIETADLIKKVRECLVENFAAPLSEKLEKSKVEITYFVKEKNLRTVLEALSDLLDFSFWHETALILEPGAGGVTVKSRFEKGIVSQSALSRAAASYDSVFAVPVTLPLKKVYPVPSVIPGKKESLLEKLGEIRKGSEVFIYWKNREGKIVTEKKRV